MNPGKLIDGVTKTIGTFGGFSIAMMFVLTSVDVTCRYVFNAPLLWVYEVTEYFMVVCVYLGLAHTDTVGGHIRIDFLLNRFRSKTRKIIELVNHLLMFGFMVLLTRQAWVLFIDSVRLGRLNMGAAHTPVAPSQLAFFIGCLVFAIHLLKKIVGLISHPANKPETEER